MSKDIHITLESGNGLLDARALWASIIGPNRLAMAQRTAVTLQRAVAVEVAKNLGASDAYIYVGVALPQNAPVNPLQVVFSRDDSTGRNTGLPAHLVDRVNQTFSFMQLLAPGEQLFAQITDANVEEANVVVATVVF